MRPDLVLFIDDLWDLTVELSVCEALSKDPLEVLVVAAGRRSFQGNPNTRLISLIANSFASSWPALGLGTSGEHSRKSMKEEISRTVTS